MSCECNKHLAAFSFTWTACSLTVHHLASFYLPGFNFKAYRFHPLMCPGRSRSWAPYGLLFFFCGFIRFQFCTHSPDTFRQDFPVSLTIVFPSGAHSRCSHSLLSFGFIAQGISYREYLFTYVLLDSCQYLTASYISHPYFPLQLFIPSVVAHIGTWEGELVKSHCPLLLPHPGREENSVTCGLLAGFSVSKLRLNTRQFAWNYMD